MQKFYNKSLAVKYLAKRIKFFAVLFFASLFSITSIANVYNVTNTTDGHATNQLRGAIEDADALGGTHTINVATGTYILTLGQIVFGNKDHRMISAWRKHQQILILLSVDIPRIFMCIRSSH